MDWGLSSRLSRILQPATGRTVMLAVDHGYFLGPTSGLEKPGETVAPLLEYADSLMCTRGVLRNCVDPAGAPPIVLRVSGGPSILRDLSNEELTVTMRDAVRLGVSAVALSIFVGSEHEKQTLVNLSRLVDEGIEHGIPVLAVTAVGREMARDARYLGLCCRIAAEMGAPGGGSASACAQRGRWRRQGCRHGPQHLPVGPSGRDDPRCPVGGP